jgi:glycosyltransferase involved in cell wall biosynthesis
MKIRTDLIEWLADFRQRHHRPLRVLHIGNIANNAFLNAKFMRSVGIDADVVTRDYYHVMAAPEWEEAVVKGDWGDDHRPDFNMSIIGDYTRPRWFIQGTLEQTEEYLRARNNLESAWLALGSKKAVSPPETTDASLAERIARRALRVILPDPIRRRHLRDLIFGPSEGSKSPEPVAEIENPFFKKIIEKFDEVFPHRPDRLTQEDLSSYSGSIGQLESIFSSYDIVQAYSTDPIFPMLASKTPYVAFEHGTLREFIKNDNATNRLTALAYRLADHVLISNGDCFEHAEWLGCPNISPIIHPLDVEQHRRIDKVEVDRLRRLYDADVILFCPLRHDWKTKGTNIHLSALPLIRRAVDARVALVITPWGAQINESRRLIEDLGCLDMVRWLDRPLSRLEMIAHLHAADVVLDQMALPHFGATAPQALAAGRPVVMSYKPESTAWIVSQPAPIFPAFTPEEVCKAVVTALDPEWQRTFSSQAEQWIDEQHSVSRLLNDQLCIYRELLDRK